MTITEAYRELDIKESASWDEVQDAYKILSKVWHPDRFPVGSAMQSKAEEKQKRINLAYTVLSDSFAGHSKEKKTTTNETICFRAVYLGGDPRYDQVKCNCDIALADTAIAVRFNNNLGVVYNSSSIMSVHEDGIVRSILIVKDPEDIFDSFQIAFQFQNKYYSKLFVKKMSLKYGLQSENTQRPHREVARGRNNGCLILFGSLMVMLAIVISVAFWGNPKYEPDYTARILSKALGTDIAMHNLIVSCGHVDVWRLSTKLSHLADQEIVFTISSRNSIVNPNQMINATIIGSDGYRQRIRSQSDSISVKDGVAYFVVEIPHAAAGVNDRLEIQVDGVKKNANLWDF